MALPPRRSTSARKPPSRGPKSTSRSKASSSRAAAERPAASSKTSRSQPTKKPAARSAPAAAPAPRTRPAISRGKKASGKPASKATRKDPRTKTTGPTPRRSPVRPPAERVADDSVRPLALAAVSAALEKKGEDPVLLDVRALSSYADYVLLLSAESERQVDALARAIEEKLRELGTRLRSTEAAGESNWLLLDFGDLVIHVFYRDARGFYDLEGLWADAPRVSVQALLQSTPDVLR